jgi:hypothetical protein
MPEAWTPDKRLVFFDGHPASQGNDASESLGIPALSRLAREGTVQRLGRGLYYYPKTNKRLGIAIPPDPDVIADALARQTGSRIAPSGATAANRLGLSTQVPAKPVYLTDGRSRQVRVGNFVVVVRHVAPKELPIGNRTSATVLQALRSGSMRSSRPARHLPTRRASRAFPRPKLPHGYFPRSRPRWLISIWPTKSRDEV